MLTFDKLVVLRDSTPITKKISLTLLPGCLLNIYGINGAGKTSLLRVLSGISNQNYGILRYDNLAIENDIVLKNYRNLVGYISEDNYLDLECSVIENLRFWASIYCSTMESLNSAIVIFKLNKFLNYKICELSSGWKKKTLLAMILLNYRKIWILDEPFAHLDIETKQILINILQQYCNMGCIVITSSHQCKINIFANLKCNLEQITDFNLSH